MVLVGKDCLRNEHLVYTYTQCTGLSQNLPFTPPCQKKAYDKNLQTDYDIYTKCSFLKQSLPTSTV